MKHRITAAALLLSIISMIGCKAPEGETPEQKNTRILDNVKDGVRAAGVSLNAAGEIEAALFKSGDIDTDNHKKASAVLVSATALVNGLNTRLANYQTFDVTSRGDIEKTLRETIGLLEDLNKAGALKLKTEKAQTRFEVGVIAAKTALELVFLFLPAETK